MHLALVIMSFAALAVFVTAHVVLVWFIWTGQTCRGGYFSPQLRAGVIAVMALVIATISASLSVVVP